MKFNDFKLNVGKQSYVRYNAGKMKYWPEWCVKRCIMVCGRK